MILKYLLMAVSTFMSLPKGTPDESRSLLEDTKVFLHEEIAALGFKLGVGIIVSSLIIFSLAQLILDAHDFVGQLPNGQMLAPMALCLLIAVGLWGLYFVFRDKDKKVQPQNQAETSKHSAVGAGSQLIGNFVSGFFDGYEERQLKRWYVEKNIPASYSDHDDRVSGRQGPVVH